ncbi:MAG TPA: TetR-like C-terminal domain-containing protein [Longimicrobiales bacterium]|nr:TetR-like C-terminal domain-containing protein [Longimicrobiales bacterium]
MARKVGLDRQDVVAAAAALADAAGSEAVTLTAVANVLGIRPPSLYAHVSGLPGLKREMALLAASRLGESLAAAASGAEGIASLRRICAAYRTFAVAHPGLYGMAQRAVAPGEDDELYDELAAAVWPVLAALAEAGVPEARRVHLARSVRSALHGFVQLEQGGGFGMPESVDESFHELVDLLMAGVASVRREEG